MEINQDEFEGIRAEIRDLKAELEKCKALLDEIYANRGALTTSQGGMGIWTIHEWPEKGEGW